MHTLYKRVCMRGKTHAYDIYVAVLFEIKISKIHDTLA